MPLHLNNFTIDIYADDTTLSLSVNWNNITSLIKALANDLENIEKWSTENWIVHQYQEDQSITCYGKKVTINLRFVPKQQACNYTLTPQISTKYCITSYWV